MTYNPQANSGFDSFESSWMDTDLDEDQLGRMLQQTYGIPQIMGPAPTPDPVVGSSQSYLQPESAQFPPVTSSQGNLNPSPSSLFQSASSLGYLSPNPAEYSQAGSFQGHHNPPSYFQATSSQSHLNLNTTQNYMNGLHQGQHNAYVPGGLEAPALSRGSSYQSSTGESNNNPTPYTQGNPSPASGQVGFGDSARPVTSPTSQPVLNAALSQTQLDDLIRIMEPINSIIYFGCRSPSPAELSFIQDGFRRAGSIVADASPSPSRVGLEPNGVDDSKRSLYQCLLCEQPPKFQSRGTFKRHVTSKHHAPHWIYCPFNCDPHENDGWFFRKDKHRLHMLNKHKRSPLNKEELAIWQKPNPVPESCPICRKSLNGWPEFWDCICRHCSLHGPDTDQGGSNGDDSDGGDDDGKDGDEGGHQHYPPFSNGNGNFGNMPNGSNSYQFGGSQLGDPSAWGGTHPYHCHGASNDTCTSTDDEDSTTTSGTTNAEPKQALDLNDLGHSKLDPIAKWSDGDTRLFGTIRTEICLRLENSISKDHRSFSKQTTTGENSRDEKVASTLVKSEASQELRRLRYFEIRIFEDQKQGSLLTYAHETLVISHPGHVERIIVSSIEEILYQTVELKSTKQPQIPGDCLFYLAKEKDHRSSEANLEATRQASPKKKGHLRVRIRAIAGVLALRAAVSKAPVASSNRETTGWELGIPLPAEEDVAKVFAWLIQVLIFFLRTPPNLKVYLMLENGSLEVPALEGWID